MQSALTDVDHLPRQKCLPQPSMQKSWLSNKVRQGRDLEMFAKVSVGEMCGHMIRALASNRVRRNSLPEQRSLFTIYEPRNQSVSTSWIGRFDRCIALKHQTLRRLSIQTGNYFQTIVIHLCQIYLLFLPSLIFIFLKFASPRRTLSSSRTQRLQARELLKSQLNFSTLPERAIILYPKGRGIIYLF